MSHINAYGLALGSAINFFDAGLRSEITEDEVYTFVADPMAQLQRCRNGMELMVDQHTGSNYLVPYPGHDAAEAESGPVIVSILPIH